MVGVEDTVTGRPVNGEHTVQPGGEQQALDPRRHDGEHEPSSGSISAAMRADENSEPSGVDELNTAQIDEQIADAGVDRLSQCSANVSDGRGT